MKFQWSKVAAVLGSYEDFIKNYGMSINSTDFSTGQVEAQLDTISAKLTQLKATLTSIVETVGEGGVTSVLKGALDAINSFVRGLQGISPSTFKLIAVLTVGIGLFKSLIGVLNTARTTYMATTGATTAMRIAQVLAGNATSTMTAKTELNTMAERLNIIAKNIGTGTQKGKTLATLSDTLATIANTIATTGAAGATSAWATAVTVLTGGLNLLLAALAVVTVGTVAYSESVGDLSMKLDLLSEKKVKLADNAVQEISNIRKQKEWLDTMSQQYVKLSAALEDNNLDAEKRQRIQRDLMATEEQLTDLIGAEAVERIKASDDIVKQIEIERAAYQKKADQKIENARQEIDTSITETENLINDSEARRRQLEKEMGTWDSLARKIRNALGAAQEYLVHQMAASAGVEGYENWKSDATLEQEKEDAENKARLEKQLEDLKARRKTLMEEMQGDVKPDTGETEDALAGGEKGSSGGGGDPYQNALRGFFEALSKAKYEAESQGNYFSKTAELELFKQYMGDAFEDNIKYRTDLLNRQRASEKERRDIGYASYDVDYFKRQLNPEFSKSLETSILQTMDAGKPLSKSMEKLRRLIEEVNAAYKGSPEHVKAMAKLYEAELQQQTALEKAVRNAREEGIKSLETMTDKELEFAKSLGLVNDSDIRKYKYARNEREYSRNMPYLENELMKTAQAGMEEEMLAAYHAFKMAQTEEDVEYSARYIMSLSGDVNATKAAIDAMMKEYDRYHQEKYRIETENYKESNKYAIALKDSFVSSYEDSLNGILERTMSFGDALRNIFKSIAKSLIHTWTHDLAERLNKILSRALHREKTTDNVGGALIGHLGGSTKVSGKSNGGLLGGLMPSMNLGGLFGGSKKALNPMASLTTGLDKFKTSLANVKGTWTNTMGAFSTTATATSGAINNLVTEGVTNFTTAENAKRAASATTSAAVIADGEVAQTSVAANIEAMMVQMLAALAVMLILSSLFGGGGSSTSESTSEVNLGRAPQSYYMTPTPVMQSTTFNVPSFDIGGNIEQDMFAMVHKGEMVLTPEQADVIRNTASNGGGAVGGGANATVKSNISVNTVDSRGFDRVLKNYNRTLSKQVKNGIRNGFLNAKGLV